MCEIAQKKSEQSTIEPVKNATHLTSISAEFADLHKPVFTEV